MFIEMLFYATMAGLNHKGYIDRSFVRLIMFASILLYLCLLMTIAHFYFDPSMSVTVHQEIEIPFVSRYLSVSLSMLGSLKRCLGVWMADIELIHSRGGASLTCSLTFVFFLVDLTFANRIKLRTVITRLVMTDLRSLVFLLHLFIWASLLPLMFILQIVVEVYGGGRGKVGGDCICTVAGGGTMGVYDGGR